jgi:hypothetical protein
MHTSSSSSFIDLADTAGDSSAASSPASAVDSTRTKTTLGESRPDLASVGTSSKSAVGIKNSITSLDEVGVAGLAVRKLVF